MELLIIWTVIAILCAIIANAKSRSGIAWFVAGVIFGVLALIVLVCMPRGTSGMKQCGKCSEHILRDARVCKHCGSEV